MYDYIFNTKFDNYKLVIAILTNVYLTFVHIKLRHMDQSHSSIDKHIKWNGSHMLVIYYDDMWKYDFKLMWTPPRKCSNSTQDPPQQ
jgi:hypothetical protein